MLDELFEIFDRKDKKSPKPATGVRGWIRRAVGDDDEHHHPRRETRNQSHGQRSAQRERRSDDIFDGD